MPPDTASAALRIRAVAVIARAASTSTTGAPWRAKAVVAASRAPRSNGSDSKPAHGTIAAPLALAAAS